ncbi:MAG: sialate O-acetylesterase [Planctomycetes bacterium]|nr:sialate O-acetylesterase [Planctomycetota bacterium]
MTRMLAVLFCLVGHVATGSGAVELPGLFKDHMVLQRESQVNVWGWAEPGEAVSVTGSWNSSTEMRCKAGPDGRWEIKLKTTEAGGPHTLTVQGSNRTVIKDVMLGEVWVCSGQSNMAWTLADLETHEALEDIVNANHDKIRFFTVPQKLAAEPAEDCDGSWQVCALTTAAEFSAVAYYYGQDLHRLLGVPIGLIASHRGATRAESWTDQETLTAFPAFSKPLKALPHSPDALSDQMPSVLFNGMIAPLTRYGIRGAIWYQGESNTDRPVQYASLFPAMMKAWRAQWHQGAFPFFYVQIAPYQYGDSIQSAALREAQLRTLRLPKTGMAVTLDLGEKDNIHPHKKKEVSQRLVLCAVKEIYGDKKTICEGPSLQAMRFEENQAVLRFHRTYGALVAKGGTPKGFTIAGKDRVFYPATAKIQNTDLILSNPKVKNPVAVRYGWSNWTEANLYNQASLPASSFRTDNWPLE